MLNRSFSAKQRVLEVCFLSGWGTFVANGLWLSSRYGYRCYRIGGQNLPGISRNNCFCNFRGDDTQNNSSGCTITTRDTSESSVFLGGPCRFTAFRAWPESILSPPHYCKTLQIPLIFWPRLKWNPKFQHHNTPNYHPQCDQWQHAKKMLPVIMWTTAWRHNK